MSVNTAEVIAMLPALIIVASIFIYWICAAMYCIWQFVSSVIYCIRVPVVAIWHWIKKKGGN